LTCLLLCRVDKANIDIPSKRWNLLSSSISSNNFGDPPVTNSVAVEYSLCCPVSQSPTRSRAAVAAVSGLSDVAIAGGVWRPGPVLRADGVDVLPGHTVKLAAGVEESLGAVSWDAGTGSWDLLLHPRIMLHTPGDVCPGAVILT